MLFLAFRSLNSFVRYTSRACFAEYRGNENLADRVWRESRSGFRRAKSSLSLLVCCSLVGVLTDGKNLVSEASAFAGDPIWFMTTLNDLAVAYPVLLARAKILFLSCCCSRLCPSRFSLTIVAFADESIDWTLSEMILATRSNELENV